MSVFNSIVNFLLAGIFLGFTPPAYAQRGNYTMDYSNAQQFFTDINGRPLYIKVDYVIEGKAYHPEDYFLATIYMTAGKAYTQVPVKFNLFDNLLIYKTPGGDQLVCTAPAVRVVFTDTADYGKMKDRIFERGYGSVNDLNPNTWYEVLDTGHLQLLKHYRVFYNDQRHYNSASISRVFYEKAEYYVALPDGSLKKLEKGEESILSILPDKKEKMSAFISGEDIKCKKESDWKKVIAFYNSQ